MKAMYMKKKKMFKRKELLVQFLNILSCIL